VLGIVQIFCGFLKAWLFWPHTAIVSGNAIVGGLAVYFIAWFFREAQELQEEQELTV
jgi:phage shock protein PspC (stress-responsive transcriptional regulator)